DAIRQIHGVRAASVVTNPQAEPTEVHVLAAPGKPAKQVVRDVQSLAMAQYNIDLDHRIVSVVQIEDDSSDEGERPFVEAVSDASAAVATEDTMADVEATARPIIKEITLRRTGTEAEAEVSLSFDDTEFTGTAIGAGAASQRARLVAQATLTALTDLLGLPADVESASVVDTGTNEVALVVLTVSVPRLGAQSVAGSALVRGDEADAVARAVLSALNRRLAQ
ncbi:MAG: hypothetical protein ABI586_06735, partial [Candidatus Nanopelagicales bacterium]